MLLYFVLGIIYSVVNEVLTCKYEKSSFYLELYGLYFVNKILPRGIKTIISKPETLISKVAIFGAKCLKDFNLRELTK